MLPDKPGRIVLKVDCAAGLPVQPPDEAAVQEDIKRDMPPRASHQKMSSISAGFAFVLGRITNSRSSAARRSQSVPSWVPDAPLSTAEIVACRSFVLSLTLVWFRPSFRRCRRMASPICLGVRAIWSTAYLFNRLYTL